MGVEPDTLLCDVLNVFMLIYLISRCIFSSLFTRESFCSNFLIQWGILINIHNTRTCIEYVINYDYFIDDEMNPYEIIDVRIVVY